MSRPILCTTHELKPGDKVRVCGAVFKLGARSVSTDPTTRHEIHAFHTEAVSAGTWSRTKRELKAFEVSGDHFGLWERA